MDKFYESVKKGGYDFERLGNPKTVGDRDRALLLDPEAWKACGKAEGWGTLKYKAFKKCSECFGYGYTQDETSEYDCFTCGGTGREEYDKEEKLFAYKDWKDQMHRFIDHLAENKPIDDFFNNLLSK